jgi:hypothetical protein
MHSLLKAVFLDQLGMDVDVKEDVSAGFEGVFWV